MKTEWKSFLTWLSAGWCSAGVGVKGCLLWMKNECKMNVKMM